MLRLANRDGVFFFFFQLKKNQTIAHASSSSASSASSVNLGGAMDRGVRSADHRKSSFVFSDGIPGLDTSLPSPGVLTPGPASAGIGNSGINLVGPFIFPHDGSFFDSMYCT